MTVIVLYQLKIMLLAVDIAYIYGNEDKQTELLYCFPYVDIGIDKVQVGPGH